MGLPAVMPENKPYGIVGSLGKGLRPDTEAEAFL